MDVVEALDWMLPQVHTPEESSTVLLDWFSAHLTDEVAANVKDKGHVLLFHGGGATSFLQISDTCLHAPLKAQFVRMQNECSAEEGPYEMHDLLPRS